MNQLKKQEEKVVSAVIEFARSIHSDAQAEACMSVLVEVTSQVPLKNFEYWERLIRRVFYLERGSIAPLKWKFWSKPSEHIKWLDLISWNGFEREQVLRELSGVAPNAFFFSLALRRLNDWVPKVREAARYKLPLIASETNPQYVVDALCIILENWNSWGRIEDIDKQVLLQIISRKEVADSLKLKLISSSSGPMASLFSQLGRTPILDGYLEEIAKSAVQPSVRARAYRCQFEGRMVWVTGRKWEWTDFRYCIGQFKPVISERQIEKSSTTVDLLKKSAADRSSIVRRVSAEFLIKNLEMLGDEAKGLAEQFAADQSNPVSERGRFALKRLEKINS
ncbi:hypothetical protein KCN56_01190 [Photobacterium galatheae]|uniref:hypothetical protein n=1 Tax=Photobacterium galatheae TaxID=1654360 RepID=UPI00202D01B6|nr:hypothetical protein [Photobacterium galatheae]MCM0147182.1 hypothetical protein [Photobacterium galatheae]